MGLKVYDVNGKTFQFSDDDAPSSAVLVKVKVPSNKGRQPSSK